MDKKRKIDRQKGMLWGLIVGDCLGSPLQFCNEPMPLVTEMLPCKFFNTPPGHWTDDSAMALCIIESVVRLKKYDLKDIANNFMRWFYDGFCSSLDFAFDVGLATQMGIFRIKYGEFSNGREDSQGNGSIMRLAPTILINGNDQTNRIIHEVSDLTHKSSVVEKTVDLMSDICRTHLDGKKTGRKSEYSCRQEVNNSGWAVSTLQAALWAFHTTNSFENALISAVNLGGDSDSIGAVTGQIAGAYYGYSAIPERWLAAIKDREKIDDLIDNFIEICNYQVYQKDHKTFLEKLLLTFFRKQQKN